MILSSDGNGNGNVIAADEDLAGTITPRPPGPGNYTVAANGAVNLGAGNPAGFLMSQNHGFFVGTGSNSIFGIMEPQSGGAVLECIDLRNLRRRLAGSAGLCQWK